MTNSRRDRQRQTDVTDPSNDLSGEGLDRLLADTRRALDSVRSAAPPGDAEPASGEGTAADGQIRARAGMPGQVTALELDPRTMRLPASELAAQITTAVNAALDDLRAQSVAAAAPVDLAALNTQLEDLHRESIQQMDRFTSAVAGAVAQIRQRGGT